MRNLCCAVLGSILVVGMSWPACAKNKPPVEPEGMICRVSNLETVAIDLPAPAAKAPVYLWVEGLVFNPSCRGRVIPALRISLNGVPIDAERLRGQEATFRFPANLGIKEKSLPKYDPHSQAWHLREAWDFQVNEHLPYNGDTWALYHVADFPGYYVFEVADLMTNAAGRLELTSILPYTQSPKGSREKPILLRRALLTNTTDRLRRDFEGEQVNFGRPSLRSAEEDVRDPDAAYELGSKVLERWPGMAAEMFRRAGMGYMEQGATPKAIACFERILNNIAEYANTQEIKARLVRAYGVAGEKGKARALAEAMSKPDPDEHWGKLARTLMALSDGDHQNIGRSWMAVRPTRTPPRIDGALNDDCWRREANITSLSVSDAKDTHATNFPTMIWAAYDSTNLYLGFRCFIDSRQISVKALARDEAVYSDECVEMFLSPGLNFCCYYELELNPLNTIYDGKNINHYWINSDWNPPWQHAVGVRARYWEAEIAVPFASLGAPVPVHGAAWLANLCRLIGPIQDAGKTYGQCQSWAPGVNDFHQLVDYGVLIFE